MAYQLEGRLLELCTCGARCPCRPEGEPDGGTCDAVNTWHIDRGTIGGTDVSGLTLVALSRLHGHVLKDRPVVFYVDDKATPQQQRALLDVWTGRLGGPVAELARLIGDVAGVERAPIAFRIRDGKGSLKVGPMIEARLAAASHEGAAHGSVPHADVCTTLPGSQAGAGEAAAYRVDAPAHGFALDLRDYPVVQGRFRFEG
jgi:hypothetical protein